MCDLYHCDVQLGPSSLPQSAFPKTLEASLAGICSSGLEITVFPNSIELFGWQDSVKQGLGWIKSIPTVQVRTMHAEI
jgi:hypothetical protein